MFLGILQSDLETFTRVAALKKKKKKILLMDDVNFISLNYVCEYMTVVPVTSFP